MAGMKDLIIGLQGSFRQLAPGVLVAATLMSCSISGENSQRQTVTAIQDDPPPAAGVEVGQNTPPQQTLTDDMVFDILLAEIAGQRGEMEVSVPH